MWSKSRYHFSKIIFKFKNSNCFNCFSSLEEFQCWLVIYNVCNINSASQNFWITLYGIFIVFLKFKKYPLSFELALRQVHSLSFFCLYVLVQTSVKQKCLYSVSFVHRLSPQNLYICTQAVNHCSGFLRFFRSRLTLVGLYIGELTKFAEFSNWKEQVCSKS